MYLKTTKCWGVIMNYHQQSILLILLQLILLVSVQNQLVKFRVHLNDDDKEKCQCISPEFCLDDDVIFDGHGLLDPRVGDRPCPNLQEICCENPQTADEIDEDTANNHHESIKSSEITCGTTPVNPLRTRMTSDSKNTEFGELPWNLLILENMPSNQKNLYRCGGSLIHPKVALTAAHCVADLDLEPLDKIIVRAGEWDTNSLDEKLPHQDSYVEEIVIHPNYNSKSLRNDIALLFLDNPFVLAQNVGIICLPININNNKIIESNCLASGWGRENFRSGRFSIILKKIGLNLVVRDRCLQLLRKTRLGRMFNLHRSFICAGGEKNKDTCKGDGGGPLICSFNDNNNNNENRFVQIGIVAWGIGCGQEHVPGVYVNVALFSDWIDDEISERDLDTSLYRI